ncbi:MAG: putative DNA binding domain-containing protein [Peptococcaceae bacterium]|jgi:ATP-dependent DNA helicase RecG|nr:putative DNA binding domain-containing protein [Peptococcaceae bacterium]
MIETEKLEFKSIVSDDIYKGVVAFANDGGGTILIGVNKQGETVPLGDIDSEYARLTNGIRDAIAPDVTMFVKYTLEEGGIIRVEISEGTYKPYYLVSKGLKPSGVYIRQGATPVPVSQEQIRQMIKNADGDLFEETRSLEQSLTFDSCGKVFAENNTAFGEDKYNVLGIRSAAQNQYTNLALLLSDQCTHTIKVAVFADGQNTVFRDRKEFAGSVLKQTEETFDYLQLCNQNRSVIDGLVRRDFWDYPKDALREALVNAIIHRDYSYSGSIIINVNDKRIEFTSIGGLPPGLLPQDIMNGISQPRNRLLVEIFHRLNLIEAYGTGIRRIFAQYGECEQKPEIVVTPNSFKLVLPNMNTAGDGYRYELNGQAKAILDFLDQHGEAAEEDLQELLNVKRTRAYTLAKQMADAGLIKIIGRGVNKKYVSDNKSRFVKS